MPRELPTVDFYCWITPRTRRYGTRPSSRRTAVSTCLATGTGQTGTSRELEALKSDLAATVW